MLCTALSGCRGQERDFILEEEGKDTVSEELLPEEKTEPSQPPSVTEAQTAPYAAEAPEEIFVDVCGAVVSPGVYALKPGSRVFQAVEAAGGFLEAAAGSCINQARIISDGQQIYVPTRAEAEERGWKPDAGIQNQGTDTEAETGWQEETRINLNTADLAELQTLSGIGEAKAQAILAYREENGSFSSVEDLMNVPGIKEGTFLKIKDQLSVE